MKAMILAAGLGTRLKPWTDSHPKALAIVNGKSLLQRNIEYLQKFGVKEVVVNVHHFAGQIIEAIKQNNGWGSNITISDETAEVLETGGGLMKAAPLLRAEEYFILMNVDILTDLDLGGMIKYHRTCLPLATLATTDRETSRYFLFDDNNNLCGWRNVKTGEEKTGAKRLVGNEVQKAFSGIHVLNSEIFSLITRKGKFSMVDVYLSLMNDYIIKSFSHNPAGLIDVGKPESLKKAEMLFR
jgi:N-acetyl-alpha-D-muramate 1-phosphate uridylyltransferase